VNRTRLGMRLDIDLAVAALVSIVVLAACSAPASSPSDATTLRVVTTTTVFADIVKQIGGEHVTVDSIIPPGVGPEDYEPKPDDARRLSEAELVVSNGVGLDDFLEGIIEASCWGMGSPR
jgi:ABC-type Zn uptake system ZnuABC Zn-binding protein ZnuA